MNVMDYKGSNFLRQRLILSTLSGKPVKIKQIRSSHENPGLVDYEVNLIELIEKITNGSKTVINVTGTALTYRPGILLGGSIQHDCNLDRGIGYYLELIFCLAPFCKKALDVRLRGITNGLMDPSVDFLKLTSLPLLKRFGLDDEIQLTITKRGSPPGGGGEIHFVSPVLRKIHPVNFTEAGKIKRIRGMAYSTRCSPQMPNRLVTSARSILNKFIPDIYIYTDHRKGEQSGKSPGFGLILVAETIDGAFLAAEANSSPKGSDLDNVTAEDVGKTAANCLLDEIYRGGCVGSVNQSLASLMLVLGESNVVKMTFGPLTMYTIEFMRHIRDFFGIQFKLQSKNSPGSDEPGEKLGSSKVLVTCVGVGYSNIAKTVR